MILYAIGIFNGILFVSLISIIQMKQVLVVNVIVLSILGYFLIDQTVVVIIGFTFVFIVIYLQNQIAKRQFIEDLEYKKKLENLVDLFQIISEGVLVVALKNKKIGQELIQDKIIKSQQITKQRLNNSKEQQVLYKKTNIFENHNKIDDIESRLSHRSVVHLTIQNKENQQDQQQKDNQNDLQILFQNNKFLNDFDISFNEFQQKDNYKKNSYSNNNQNQQQQQRKQNKTIDQLFQQDNINFQNEKQKLCQIQKVLDNSFYINYSIQRKQSLNDIAKQILTQKQSNENFDILSNEFDIKYLEDDQQNIFNYQVKLIYTKWFDQPALIVIFSDIEKKKQQQKNTIQNGQWYCEKQTLRSMVSQESVESGEDKCYSQNLYNKNTSCNLNFNYERIKNQYAANICLINWILKKLGPKQTLEFDDFLFSMSKIQIQIKLNVNTQIVNKRDINCYSNCGLNQLPIPASQKEKYFISDLNKA
ncbi:hypothetical protein PPERSA_00340 [Pseudocohnilembus persalinus]|uniref:Transmembrane protein n=1 Tax=Pseudocohnilembus persalinus TaxID=266149 RepID=A0A0V0QXX2_PSEPJ|nr:hypothetical protein PPERSA_00340 [Pseudocohnilembus persalinus]|eukprot:KRX07183.1 hypothetical protein PPERSA_00340 [Pseudocohnilembus persalinus]